MTKRYESRKQITADSCEVRDDSLNARKEERGVAEQAYVSCPEDYGDCSHRNHCHSVLSIDVTEASSNVSGKVPVIGRDNKILSVAPLSEEPQVALRNSPISVGAISGLT